jgi:phage terminase small subunit
VSEIVPISRAAARRKRDLAVYRLTRKLVTLVPALEDAQFRPLVTNYCRLAVLCERAYDRIREASLLDDNGELRSSLDTYRRMTGELRAMGRELGLSPTVAASMARPVRVLDLEAMRDEADDAQS